MYWGGYVYYNITGMKKSVHKDAIISSVFVVKIDKGRGFIEKTYPFYQKTLSNYTSGSTYSSTGSWKRWQRGPLKQGLTG